MIKVYVTSVSGYEPDLETALTRLSDYRIGKAQKIKSKKSVRLSLAAGLLLDYAIREYGLYERDMEYGENEHGKPFFKNRSDIEFSLSHSGIYAMCAVSDGAVGADIEILRGNKQALKIAERYFTDNEYEYIKTSGDPKKAFFELWTKKESLLKALGTGISGGLASYEVLADTVEAGDTKFYFKRFDLFKDAAAACCSKTREDGDIKFVAIKDMMS